LIVIWLRYEAPKRHLSAFQRMPTFHPHLSSHLLDRYAFAVSMMRPVNGLNAALLRLSEMCERRYSAPKPRLRRPSEVFHAMAGSTDRVFTFASRDMKRPTH